MKARTLTNADYFKNTTKYIIYKKWKPHIEIFDSCQNINARIGCSAVKISLMTSLLSRYARRDFWKCILNENDHSSIGLTTVKTDI